MKAVTLTAMQRVSMDAVLSQQKDLMEELFIFLDIRDKLNVKALSGCFKDTDRGRMWDLEAIKFVEDITVEFEKQEVRKLLNVIKTTQFVPDDLDWLVPLKKQLEAQ